MPLKYVFTTELEGDVFTDRFFSLAVPKATGLDTVRFLVSSSSFITWIRRGLFRGLGDDTGASTCGYGKDSAYSLRGDLVAWSDVSERVKALTPYCSVLIISRPTSSQTETLTVGGKRCLSAEVHFTPKASDLPDGYVITVGGKRLMFRIQRCAWFNFGLTYRRQSTEAFKKNSHRFLC